MFLTQFPHFSFKESFFIQICSQVTSQVVDVKKDSLKQIIPFSGKGDSWLEVDDFEDL